MAKKKKKSKKDNFDDFSHIKKETFQSILAIVFFLLSVFLLLGVFKKAGPAGDFTVNILMPLLGWGYFILPVILIALGIALLLSIKKDIASAQSIGAAIFLIAGLGFIALILPEKGGSVGRLVANPISKLFDDFLAGVILVALLVISALVMFDAPLQFHLIWDFIKRLFGKKEGEKEIENQNELEKIKISGAEEKGPEETEEKSKEPAMKSPEPPKKKSSEDLSINLSQLSVSGMVYNPPPLSILSRDSGKPEVGDIKANANIIKRTLQNFGINVEMDEITIGPTVTRYALKPAEGVKLSRIVGLQNDLALALAAHPLRIEAPIPGKSLVGIEIPNSVKTTVGLGSIISQQDFQNSAKPLLVALGKAISGQSYFDDLAKMPHLLVAGSTGSGKSVAIHSIIASLLYRNSPENMKFILIDPKRVELTLYNKIPHLLTPVITDPKKAILSLKWAAKEMDRRYDILEAEKVRDISSYHKNVVEPALKNKKNKSEETELPEAMPYIVIIIDELADIMSSYPRELEAAIVRLAQMSRAVGIHLILSTQRPSVNVITGLIKANIPARMALQVASQVDSRTILDMAGAEKLLGAGDMLFLSSEMSKPQRIQTAFIAESEAKAIVKYLIDNYSGAEDHVSFELQTANASIELSAQEEDEDELYEEARELVIAAGKASTSYLQRRLKVGYARAARLIDMLEERGVVGPGEGSKPREVLGGYESEEGEENEND